MNNPRTKHQPTGVLNTAQVDNGLKYIKILMDDDGCIVGYSSLVVLEAARATLEIYFYFFSSILKSLLQFLSSFLAILFILFYVGTILRIISSTCLKLFF